MTVTAVAASRVAHSERAALWNDAFSDYYTPGSFTAESLQGFEKAFDLDLDASRLVLEEDRPVAFAMLGIRGRRGWVGGMGVIPAARRRRHGARVMRELIDSARERGLSTLGLEVLVQNEPAIPLYEGLGFRTLRKVEVWDRAADTPAPPAPAAAAPPLALDSASALADRWRKGPAVWQREIEPGIAAFPGFEAVAAGPGPVAVALFRATPERIGLLDLEADPEAAAADREAALDTLLATVFSAHPSRLARLLNLPERHAASAALARAGAAVAHRQWEMELAL
jgi:ribosomal protein S18 acetylase RimI-like enzyme